jgi:transcriptional regulator with XRE-family HTH domain
VWTLSDRIKKAREVTGLSQKDLAEKTGISMSTISNYESGATSPRKAQITLIAWATGVDRGWLETGIATPTSPDGEEKAAISDSVRSKGFEPPTF